MLFTEIIATKRDGGALSDAMIQQLVDGLSDDSLPAEQVSALAMAIFLNGMNFDEAAALTRAMAASGTSTRRAVSGTRSASCSRRSSRPAAVSCR